MPRITKRVVDAATKGEKDTYVWDDELTGFGLKVTPAGRKVFFIQYRTRGAGARTRRYTIGNLGPITTDEARTQAKTLLGLAKAGQDPAAERDREKTEKTVGEVLDLFLDEHVTPTCKPRTDEEYRRLIKLHVPKDFRNRSMAAVEHHHVAKLHRDMKAKPYPANRLLAVLSKMFNWASKNGHLPKGADNPCRHVTKYDEVKRERYLSSDELAALSSALAASDESIYVVSAIRLLLFTGARLSEVLTAQWAWVNMETGTIRLPDSKTGAKTLYLNAPALTVLKSLPRKEKNPFIICGEKEGAHLVNLQKPWRAIRSAAGLNDVRIHDLRHTFASIAAGGNMSLRTIGGLLGHSQTQTTDRYAHLASDPMREASNVVAKRIERAMRGTGKDNVVPMKRKPLV